MDYRGEIDGLRAVAVLAVIVFHAGFALLPGGFLGVDVFFVISGYLITGLLLNDLLERRFSILRFYERRARRILPALFFVMLACLPFAWVWMMSFEFKDFGQSMLAVVLFVSNLFFWRTTDYFGPLADVQPLLHTWSLGVEEQFYLLFPLMLLVLWRFGRRFAFGTVAVVMVASFVLAYWAGERMPVASFYLLPTRAWELLAGAACGFLTLRRPQPSHGALAGLGLGMIVAPLVLFEGDTRTVGALALVPVIGTMLVILFAARQTVVARLLSVGPMVAVGLMSYSAYLWHQPVFAFARIIATGDPGPVVMAGLIVLVMVLAYATWRWVETPFRGKAPLFASPRGLFGAAFAAGAVLALAGGVIVRADGFSNRSNGSVTMGALAESLAHNPGLAGGCTDTKAPKPACMSGPDPKVLLWGDSFAMHLAKGIEASAKGRAFVQITRSQCAPILDIAQRKNWITPGSSADSCIAFNEGVLDYIREKRPEVVVMASALGLARWPVTKRNSEAVEGDSADITAEYLVRTAEAVRATGARVVFVAPTPDSGRDNGRCAIRSIYSRAPETRCDFALKTESIEYTLLRKIEDRVAIYWLSKDLCTDGICKTRAGEMPIYRDQGHLSMAGSRLIGERAGWMEAFVQMAR